MACSAWARDIFVDNQQGDDHREGLFQSATIEGDGPVRTIAKALRLARAGDFIEIANTGLPYREAISLTGSRHSGSASGPFVINGNGATIDGSASIPPEAWEHLAGDVFAVQPHVLGYQQLFINGEVGVRRDSRSGDPAPPSLGPLEWCFWDARILFRAEDRMLPPDYELSCCRLPVGITLYYVENVIIRDLQLQGFQIDGVKVHDAVRSSRLQNLTCRHNGRSGICVAGSSRAELVGCKLAGNGTAQLRTEGHSHTWLTESGITADTAPAIDQAGGQIFER